jgi:DNA-binding winged helix-turn-helix (wHTH) protein
VKETPQSTQITQVIRFATFEVDLRAGEVRKGGMKLKLSGQPFQVLAMLLEQPGQVVTREELQKRLWPDTFVDVEHSLNAAVNRIREVLGDTAENPRFVETIPRRGYRFIAQVMNGDNRISAEMERVRTEEQADKTGETANPRLARNVWLVRGTLTACVLIAAGGWLAYKLAKRDVIPPTLQRNLTRITFDEGLQIGATWSPDGRYIAYSSTHGGKSDIWVQQVSGGNPIRITMDNGNNWQPDWSRDGKYIAYRSEEGGGGLFVVPTLGGAGMQRRISEFGAYPRWSPDNRQILFQSTGFGVPCKVFVVDANGGKRPQEVLPGIAAEMQVMSATWHPQ